MKTYRVIIPLIFCILSMDVVSSCDSNKQEANTSATEFFHSLQKKDSLAMRQFYPDVDNLINLCKSDSIVIINTEKKENGDYHVDINNIYENEEFEQVSKPITLILSQLTQDSSQPKYQIKNSIGLVDYTQFPIYKFANLVGCFDPYFPETDIETCQRMDDVANLYINYSSSVYQNIRDNVKISDYVEIGSTPGFVEVTALIVNNSDFDVKNIKYKLDFWSRNYESQDEEGLIFPEGIKSGTSRATTLKTSYIGLKSIKMFFRIDFETKEIENCVFQLPFKGNEYRKYLVNKNVN